MTRQDIQELDKNSSLSAPPAIRLFQSFLFSLCGADYCNNKERNPDPIFKLVVLRHQPELFRRSPRTVINVVVLYCTVCIV